MLTRVVLRVLGVDLDDDELVESITEHLGDFAWSVVDGVTRATLFIESGNIVSHVVDSAHRIQHKIPGSRIDEVDEELVAIPDISARTKVHRETVRAWINGTRGAGDFPMPVGSLGGGGRGSMRAWRWAEVNAWLDQHYSLGDGYLYPSRKEYAEINAFLARAEYMLTAVLPDVSTPPLPVNNNQYLKSQETPLLTLGVGDAYVQSNASNNLLIRAKNEL
jgi:predicted DNA-binding transcriptional regulator AlpA